MHHSNILKPYLSNACAACIGHRWPRVSPCMHRTASRRHLRGPAPFIARRVSMRVCPCAAAVRHDADVGQNCAIVHATRRKSTTVPSEPVSLGARAASCPVSDGRATPARPCVPAPGPPACSSYAQFAQPGPRGEHQTCYAMSRVVHADTIACVTCDVRPREKTSELGPHPRRFNPA